MLPITNYLGAANYRTQFVSDSSWFTPGGLAWDWWAAVNYHIHLAFSTIECLIETISSFFFTFSGRAPAILTQLHRAQVIGTATDVAPALTKRGRGGC